MNVDKGEVHFDVFTKWFMGLVATFLLGLATANVTLVIMVTELKSSVNFMKSQVVDRYTKSDAGSQIKLQELRDLQQDDRIARALDMLHDRTDRFSQIENRINSLEKEVK